MKHLFAFLLSLVLITACSDPEKASVDDTHAWKTQTDAHKKATEVEQLLQDSTTNRMQTIKD